MSNLKFEEINCERCQNDIANIICKSCEPFHYFCPKCDSIIHSMKLRLNHIRQNLNLNLSSPKSYTNYNSPKKKLHKKSFTPNKQGINNYLYGKDFLDEINRIHEKEKETLIYKINTLENNNERIKLNFQNEIKKYEEKIKNILTEKKYLEDKYNEILAMTIKKNEEKIGELLNENNLLKEKNRIMKETFEKNEEILNFKLEECNNNVNELKNELINERKNNNFMNKTHINKITEIVKNNNTDIKNLNELHKKEMNELYFDAKVKNEKLMQDIKNAENRIEFLVYENEKLRNDNKKLENENNELINSNGRLNLKIEDISKEMEVIRDINKNLQLNNEKLKVENKNMKNDCDYFNNIINENKKELYLLNEAYKKKENEYNYLFESSEKIRKAFSENMFNNEDLEFNNRKLRIENDELKKMVNSFNGNNICYNSFSN